MAFIFNINGQDKRFLQKELLGQGGFGQVYRVTDASTQQSYAVKVINAQSSNSLQSAKREIEQLTQASHPNIIKIFSANQVDDQVHILLEYCSGGNLDMKLQPNIITTIGQDMKWALQVADAIKYLHSENIVHRDLKPHNIVLTANLDAKVADFGLARPFLTGPNWQQTYEAYYLQTKGGTPRYMAPEVWKGHYTEKADIYSMGVIFFVMFGRKAIPNFHGIVPVDVHAVAQQMSTDGQVDAGIKKLVLDMISHDYNARPSASEVCQRLQ
eukprot:Seg2070.5 transcript_id=Seg2070.5/GoldUCD/mRNA.D3Y31 product="Calcium-dependent protein kinase 2" protein_id=Seg2070.5/GoldUCD/D3Y31